MSDATVRAQIPLATPPDAPRCYNPPGCRRSEDYFLRPTRPRHGFRQTGGSGVEAGGRQTGQEPAGGVPLDELLGGQKRERHAVEGQGRPVAPDTGTRRGSEIARPAAHADPSLPQGGVDPLLAPADQRTHVHSRRGRAERGVLVRRGETGQTAGKRVTVRGGDLASSLRGLKVVLPAAAP